MLAAHHDQENLFTNQAGAIKQPLQAKTPGARYPKTPLKVPLNDENANHGFNGKSVLRDKGHNENILTVSKGGNAPGKSGKLGMLTPAEPRTARAPLGNKTTNAKARATHQTPGGKAIGARDFDKINIKPTTTLRLKPAASQSEPPRLEVHADNDRLEQEEIEYAPPKPKDLPYKSDVFPDDVLTFEGLKPENLFKGYYQYYFNRVGADGKTALERDMEEQQKRSFERGEEQIRRDMEEFDWSIGDIPESKDLFKKKSCGSLTPSTTTTTKKAAYPVPKQPSTIASRKAASALAIPVKSPGIAQPSLTKATAPPTTKVTTRGFLLPKRKPAQPAAQPTIPAYQRVSAAAASKSTLGYNKGRSVSSAVHGPAHNPIAPPAQHQTAPAPKPRTLVRSVSTASTSSDATITPARFAQSSKESRKPDFLSIFDDDEEEYNLGGGLPPTDDDNDDFQLTVRFE
ncbi:hypothetical protein N657DRAFT_691529 [Parathielavia appendiculata]|uniref:Uncharacterized protein n=1 Tax=Parathielavia appendiculata TaxID=2587402 RepID=A0AAN6Z325_9PEZI|nr:hypothetical protein N657DRAFT_691529 [Parathielavia appendiculata]